jgi:hypothetical protein
MKISEIASLAIDLVNDCDSKTPAREEKPDGVSAVVTPGNQLVGRTPLREFLESLPADAVYWLTAVMYIGREDLEAADLRFARKSVSETFTKPEWAANQMGGKSDFGEYLRDGLDAIARAGIDLDAEVGEIRIATCPSSVAA